LSFHGIDQPRDINTEAQKLYQTFLKSAHNLKTGERTPKHIDKETITEKEWNKAQKDVSKWYNRMNRRAIKSGSMNSIDTGYFIIQSNPYTTTALTQFEEAARADGIVSRSGERKADYVFAKGIRCVLEPTYDDFDDDKARADEMKRINDIPKYEEAKKKLYKLNKKIQFDFFCRAAYINSGIYGRSALLKEDNTDDGLPKYLQILASRLLGNVFLDPNSKQIAAVEYNDSTGTGASLKKTKLFYEPKDLIYFTRRDYNITANTKGYGLSDIEPVKDISETNRVYDEEDLKEIARMLWAGFVLFKFPSLNDQNQIQQFLDELEPARPTAISTDVVADVINVAHDMEQIVEARNQNDRRILRSHGLPSFALGFEDVTNRATAQWILNAWKESFIEQERIWMAGIVEPQWLYYLWAKLLNIDEDAIWDEDAVPSLSFYEYDFETRGQKISAWLPVYQLGIINNIEFFEKIGDKEMAAKTKELKTALDMLGGGLQNPDKKVRGAGKIKTGEPAESVEDTQYAKSSGENDLYTGLNSLG
jgi:hypothetical protein